MKKTLIWFITMLFGAGMTGFGFGKFCPQLDLPIAVLIEVIGIITLIVGEHFYLKSQKDETP